MKVRFPKPLKRTASLTRKEIQTIVKDRTAMLMVFLLPIITIGTLALALQQNKVQTETVPMTIGIIDLDTTHTYPGQDLSENFTAELGRLEGVTTVIFANESEAHQALFQGDLDGYVVIEDGFDHALALNLPTTLQVHTSSTDLAGQSDVFIAVTTASLTFRYKHGWIRSEIIPMSVLEFVPEGDFKAAQIGAFLVVFCIFMGIAMTSCQSIVGDVPLRRMLLTPTSKVEVVVAKLTAYTIIGIIQSLLLVVLWVLGFQLVLMTGLESLLMICMMTALAGAVSGVCISVLSTSRLQANQGFLFLLLGMLILSGIFLDVGIIKDFLPMNIGIALIQNTAFKGLPLIGCLPEISRMLLYIAIGTLLAIVVMWRRRALA
jgi:ABC-2 type transport system permease protein